MKVTFLGTGTSHGVPMIGCDCGTCRSTDPRDRRLRPSIYVQTDAGSAILVDAGPDLRLQALTHDIRRVDAVLFTHGHADHILGIDEIRRFNALQQRSMRCYGDTTTLAEIRQMFGYVFNPATPKGGGVPDLELVEIEGPFTIDGQRIVPVPLLHGRRPILGFRFGRFAYLTDCSAIPDESWPLLDGVDVLVVDALRRRPHPTHFSIDEAVAATRRIAPQRAYFTHMCHDLPHAATCETLPDGIELAYDGLALEL
ncbi:MAG TPA: MBL fold metallo-hydrolase [Vicinamibacterales bacterium]|nr:MBL fold metallo-hydrolase [Vicinamibacterales bacterium]